MTERTVIIGGGPAGLTAAWELAREGGRALVLEADTIVGGISRTASYKGYRFDVGGHRFFTKVPHVQQVWEELIGDEFLVRPRLSRIFYRGKMFNYPLKPANAVLGLGAIGPLAVAWWLLWIPGYESALAALAALGVASALAFAAARKP